MSSLFASHPDPQQMPGLHYSRIMAYSADLPTDRAAKVRESAQFLIGSIPVEDEVAVLHDQLDALVTHIAEHPQLFYGHPGEGYWPIRLLVEKLHAAGLTVDLPGYMVKNGGVA